MTLQAGKGAPYYVGAAQTLPRGMYSDRNKNIIGKFRATDAPPRALIFFFIQHSLFVRFVFVRLLLSFEITAGDFLRVEAAVDVAELELVALVLFRLHYRIR